jgi:O-antigen/teichoic acid export membrane protein
MIKKLRTAIKGLFYGDYFPIFALIVAIQGTVLISQGVAALMIPPAELGVIRTFESVFSVMLLVAGFGASALAIREMAIPGDDDDRGRALRNLLLLPIIGAVVTTIGAVVLTIAGARFISGPALSLTLGMGLLIAVNFVRLSAAIAQGLQIARKVWLFASIGAGLCAIIQVVGALNGTLTGWITGRLSGEAVLLTGLLFAMRGTLPKIRWLDPINLRAFLTMMSRAMVINAAFILRMLADAAPIVMLALIIRTGGDRADVGYFGIGTLLVTLGLMPISVFSQQLFPILASSSSVQEARRVGTQMLHQLLGASITVMVALILVVILSAEFGIRNFEQGGGIISILMFSVPLRALSVGFSTMMIAYGSYSPSLWVNLIEFVVVVAIFLICKGFVPPLWIAVAASLSGAMVSLIGMFCFDRALPRKSIAC